MAQTIAENQICNACGADVRKGALFCYYCGGSVAPAVVAPKAETVDEDKQLSAKENNSENGKKTRSVILKDKPGSESVSVKENAENLIPKPEVQPENNLKTAASLRKKSKSVQKKKVEIIWEEHESPPNVLFVLAALFLTAFALGIMWLALYFG